MNFQFLEGAIETRQSSKGNTSYKLGAARSSGDGTIDDGDHQFKRLSSKLAWKPRWSRSTEQRWAAAT